MPKPSNVARLKPRMPKPVDESLARKLEAAAEVQGNRLPGEPTTAVPAAALEQPAADRPAAKTAEPAAPEPAPVQAKAAASVASAPIAEDPSKVVGTMTTPRQRKDGTKLRSTSIHMPIDLGKQLKLHCVEHGLRQNDVLIQALSDYLSAQAQ